MGKVVLITGATGELGKTTVKEFAKKGYNVVIHYHLNKNLALKLANEIKSQYKVDTLVVNANIANEDEIKSMIKIILNKFKTIDVLVNNASISNDTLFIDKTKDNFMKILEVNLVGTFLISRLVGDIMLEGKTGRIINISSTNGIDTYYPESLDYDASKAGIISLTHNLAKVYAPYINVNCIAPGWIKTNLNKGLDYEFRRKEEEKILFKRFAKPEEIARVIVFLASDEASYINNSIIRVDGGKNE